MEAEAFVRKVDEIAQSRPSYQEGGTGADGSCDCIGLVMGALYRLGRRAYPMHSSNYFARYQTENLAAIAGKETLLPGMIVYKARDGANCLNARYLPGGRYDTGDLLDYYHAGVVESTEPLVIVHCTSSGTADGIVRDHTAAGWTHAGFIAGISYGSPQTDALCDAVVTAQSGSTVNLRSRPNNRGAVIARIPVGTPVSVCESAQGWAKVVCGDQTGYMMAQFLMQESPLEKRLAQLEQRVEALERRERTKWQTADA